MTAYSSIAGGQSGRGRGPPRKPTPQQNALEETGSASATVSALGPTSAV